MATLGTTALTYADWAKRVDPDMKIATIVELLSQTNEILQDMLVMEGNLVTGHKTSVRTGLPASTWRLLNYGVTLSKSDTAQITDTCGNLEAENQIDVDVAKLNGNTAEFRLSESKGFLESMNQTMAQTLWYGNQAVNPERFTGLAPRYSTVSTASALTAYNVLDAGGTQSDNMSIWLITWGDQTTFGIFPKGSKAGLDHEDMGKWRVNDSNGLPYWAWVDHYKWELGLTVKDWRYNARIANISAAALASGSPPNLINLLVRMVNRIPTMPRGVSAVQTSDAPTIQGAMGRSAIYVNRIVRTYLELQAMNKTNVLLQLSQWEGQTILTFRGIPIRTSDQLLATEARVV